MKKMAMALLMALVALALVRPCLAAGPGLSGGQIVTDDGKVIQVVEFVDLVDTLPVVLDDTEENVPLADVKSLTRADDDMVALENVKGQSFKVVMPMAAVGRGEAIEYLAVDPISGQVEQGEIDGVFVRRIVFDRP